MFEILSEQCRLPKCGFAISPRSHNNEIGSRPSKVSAEVSVNLVDQLGTRDDFLQKWSDLASLIWRCHEVTKKIHIVEPGLCGSKGSHHQSQKGQKRDSVCDVEPFNLKKRNQSKTINQYLRSKNKIS